MKESEEDKNIRMMEIENELYDKGYTAVCGIDEAGRGPLFGPVVAAAVILDRDCVIEGINDSKKLSEKKRESMYEEIVNKSIAFSAYICDVDIIEDVNILNATKIAMKNALESLPVKCDFALIDGNQKIDTKLESRCVVSGDSKSLSIAAASIIAKVTRDRLILEYDKKYPEYGLAKHKGYGTKNHILAIKEHGITTDHRKSFCTKFI